MYYHEEMHKIETYVLIPSIFISIIMGLIYDVRPRGKALLIPCFVLLFTGIVYMWSYGAMIGARVAVAICCQTILQNPLMNDYVKCDSRGRGAGIEKFGYVIGVAVAFYAFTFIPLIDRLEASFETEGVDFMVVILVAVVCGIFCTCVTTYRRVSRNYVVYTTGIKRVKEELEVSDDEEDTDCEVDYSNMGDY